MFANPVFITPGTLHQMKEIQGNSILVRVRVHQQVRGAVGSVVVVGGGLKKYGLKGGIKRKHIVFKGGVTKKSLKFCSDDICNYANSPPEYQKLAFPIFRNFRFFPRRHVSGLPTVSLGESDKLTDFSLFIFFPFICSWGGGVISINLGHKGGGGPKK